MSARILLGIDLILIVVHFGLWMSGWQFGRMRLDWDRGIPELFNYIEIFLLIVILLQIWRTSRVLIYLAWGAVFTVVLLDDSLMIHERVGRAFTAALDLPRVPGLRVQDTGEMLTWLLLGAPLAGLLIVGFLRAPSAHRPANAIIAMLLAMLVGFAVGADMLHIAASAEQEGLTMTLLEILEDGGEMVVVSLICIYSLLLARHPAAFGLEAQTK